MRGKDTQSILKLLVLILPIAAVVMISGCITGGTGQATGPGLVILNWEPDHASVESGDDVQFRLKVKNQGGEQAEGVRAALTTITIGGDEWLPKVGSEEVLLKQTLLPPNPRYGTQGEEETFIWELKAPMLPEGITRTYTPGVRVFYDYTTTAVKPITLVNENELRRLMDTGGTLPTQPSQHSAGPLSVSVATGNTIKVSETRGNQLVPITIHVENTGGGIPFWSGAGSVYYGIPEDAEYYIMMAIELPPGLAFAGPCNEFSGYGVAQGGEVYLWKGRSADVTCELDIVDIPTFTQESTIKLYLTYGYAIDRLTSVTVKGLPGG
jgi:hypothetical protein